MAEELKNELIGDNEEIIESAEEFNENEEKKIVEYGEGQIQVLEGLEAVRKRPGMYIGSTSQRGLHHLVYEIVDNSIDESLAGFCRNITVKFHKDNSVSVRDDGRGVPAGIHEKMGIPTLVVVFTVLHAGGKFGGGGYAISGGLHGVGASVVNALSTKLDVIDYYNGKEYRVSFERGKVSKEFTMVGDTEEHGLYVRFYPDGEIFDELVFDYETIEKRLREQSFLNAGINITLIDERSEEEYRSEFCYEGGIRSFVEYINSKKHCQLLHKDVIYLSGAKGTAFAEVALQYNDTYNETIMTFANNINTIEGGTHETGFKNALTRVMNEYGKKYNILKNDDKLLGEDVREGLTAVVSVKLENAQFEGQTKTKLGNSEMRGLVESLVYGKLSDFMEENPSVAKGILEKAVSACIAREAARKARESTRRKSVLESSSMPDKLADCNERRMEFTELFMVEGDSAGGSAKDGRDSKFQAILPLRGKILNVEKARLDRIYSSVQIVPIIMALGTGIGSEFDISKLRYGKVIIMADADVDGAHIKTLLLTFFFRHMRPLIEHGHIYAAVPPLFKVFKGKQERYAYSDEERDKYMTELGQGAQAERYKGLGEMDPEQLWETTMDPEKRILKRITIEDAYEADEIFSVLMGDAVEPRREFIEKNARYVTNLDV